MQAVQAFNWIFFFCCQTPSQRFWHWISFNDRPKNPKLCSFTRRSRNRYRICYFSLYFCARLLEFAAAERSPQGNWKRIENPTTRPLRPNMANKSFSSITVWVRVCWRVRMHVSVWGGHKTEISCNWSLRFAFAFFGFVAVGLVWPSSCSLQLSHFRLYSFPCTSFCTLPPFVSGLAWPKGQTIRNITY